MHCTVFLKWLKNKANKQNTWAVSFVETRATESKYYAAVKKLYYHYHGTKVRWQRMEKWHPAWECVRLQNIPFLEIIFFSYLCYSELWNTPPRTQEYVWRKWEAFVMFFECLTKKLPQILSIPDNMQELHGALNHWEKGERTPGVHKLTAKWQLLPRTP